MGDVKSAEHKGVIPRLTEAIFDAIENADGSIEFTVCSSPILAKECSDRVCCTNWIADQAELR